MAATFLGLAAMMACASDAISAPVDRGVVKLPEGRLLLVAGNEDGAVLIGLDNMIRKGSEAVVLVYRVFEPARALDSGVTISEEAEVQRFDCDAQSYQSLGASEYNAAGEEVLWMEEEPVKPVQPRTMTSRVASVVCGQVKLPPGNIAKDRATAKAMVAQALQATH